MRDRESEEYIDTARQKDTQTDEYETEVSTARDYARLHLSEQGPDNTNSSPDPFRILSLYGDVNPFKQGAPLANHYIDSPAQTSGADVEMNVIYRIRIPGNGSSPDTFQQFVYRLALNLGIYATGRPQSCN